jgi:hypothetical protein
VIVQSEASRATKPTACEDAGGRLVTPGRTRPHLDDMLPVRARVLGLPGAQRTWSGSGTVELSLDPLTFGGCNIVETDLRVTNGFVHAIDCIVLPQEVVDAAAG